MDTMFIIRILAELVVVLIAGILAYMAAWQLRQDSSIRELREETKTLSKSVHYVEHLAEHNIPDAWENADKARDTLIENLTRLCLRTCEPKAQSPQKPPGPGPKHKKHP